jgi:hypothetical protein
LLRGDDAARVVVGPEPAMHQQTLHDGRRVGRGAAVALQPA